MRVAVGQACSDGSLLVHLLNKRDAVNLQGSRNERLEGPGWFPPIKIVLFSKL